MRLFRQCLAMTFAVLAVLTNVFSAEIVNVSYNITKKKVLM